MDKFPAPYMSPPKSFFKVIFGVVLIALFAQLSIDLPIGIGIPITGQSFIILLLALFFTPTESFICVGLYLIIGILGLPVFAEASSGWSKITGGSGGFLYGFLIAAVSVSFLKRSFEEANFIQALALTFLGTLILISFGVLHLTFLYGFEKALEYGFFPFWKGAIIKVVLGAGVYALISKIFGSSLGE